MGNTESNVASGVKKQVDTSSLRIYNLVDLKGTQARARARQRGRFRPDRVRSADESDGGLNICRGGEAPERKRLWI